MQQGVQNETVLGVVGQQCCVHLQRFFKDQSYSVKKSTNNNIYNNIVYTIFIERQFPMVQKRFT